MHAQIVELPTERAAKIEPSVHFEAQHEPSNHLILNYVKLSIKTFAHTRVYTVLKNNYV